MNRITTLLETISWTVAVAALTLTSTALAGAREAQNDEAYVLEVGNEW